MTNIQHENLPRCVEGCIEGDNEGNIQDCHQDDHVPDLKYRLNFFKNMSSRKSMVMGTQLDNGETDEFHQRQSLKPSVVVCF